MILCENGCIPCCDYCIYSIRDTWVDEEGVLRDQGPMGCTKHLDAEHQEIADACGHCEDFHCSLAK